MREEDDEERELEEEVDDNAAPNPTLVAGTIGEAGSTEEEEEEEDGEDATAPASEPDKEDTPLVFIGRVVGVIVVDSSWINDGEGEEECNDAGCDDNDDDDDIGLREGESTQLSLFPLTLRLWW